jgi:ABC-type lipoprotein export system ATPase subunit
VEDNIRLYLSLRGSPVEEGLERARELAAEVGIEGLLNRRPGGLSGGEARRAELVLALSDNPPLVLLDEPTAMLDHESVGAVVDLIGREARERALLIATHDPRLNRVASARGWTYSRPGGLGGLEVFNPPSPRPWVWCSPGG